MLADSIGQVHLVRDMLGPCIGHVHLARGMLADGKRRVINFVECKEPV